MTQEKTLTKKRTDKKFIALAVVCIMLAASLVGAIAVFQLGNSDLQAQLSAKNSQISNLKNQIAGLTAQSSSAANVSTYVQEIAYLNQQLQYLNDTLTGMNSDNMGYQQILNFELSGMLYDSSFTQDANTSTTVWNDQLNYAGYVLVYIQATTNTTYAQIIYTYGDTNFNYNQTVGTSGTAVFPVISSPASPGIVQINIGNLNQPIANNVNATVTYYY